MCNWRIVTWSNENTIISFCGTWVNVGEFFSIAARQCSTSSVPHNSLIETYATCRHRRPHWLTRPTFSPPYTGEETSLVLQLGSFSLWKFVISLLIPGCVENTLPGPAEIPCFLNGRKSEFLCECTYRPWIKFP